ncbi:hypothetical protein [Sphingomonas sp. PR090111-T3T-6A]|uniref:hypothetical protein n=1 Tax=Sphingomonas sp. PR090111-T3T-6A TaxID=685778 RepID=UPI000363583F|nr:hypothetical protein [Sphingomonas sp. PR090111-T3T-6A]
MRRIAILLGLLACSCGQKAAHDDLRTRALLATVERHVTTCTASTGRLGPLVARNERRALMNAAIDARNRCSDARAQIARAIGKDAVLDACRRDVDAQERISLAQMAVLDNPTPEGRAAVLQRLDEAVPLQEACGQAIDTLRSGRS